MNAIKLISQNRFRVDFGTAGTSWDLFNVGEALRIETIFTIRNEVISSDDEIMILNDINGLIGAGWITAQDDSFIDFKIGDVVQFYDYINNVDYGQSTIIDKKGNASIQMNTVVFPLADNFQANNVVATNATAITAIKYHYGFVENSAADSFLSPVDGSEQMIVAKSKLASDATTTAMTFEGPLMWQSGSATIEGVPGSSGVVSGRYQSTFKIIHYTKCSPYILENQLQNQLDGIPPDDFSTINKCWKYISFVEAAQLYTNPNYLVGQTFDTILGNTGWYGESLNTGKTNYSATIAYKDSLGKSTPSIGLSTNETTIVITLRNTIDAPFSNNNTKFVLEVFKVPDDPAQYQTSGLLDDNMLFDRKAQTVGSAAANGDQFGVVDRQVLKNVHGTFISSSQITIECGIDMLAAVIAKFQDSSVPRYLIAVSTQNYLLDTTSAVLDAVTLQIDLNTFTVVTSDPGMIIIEPAKFIRHPEVNPATEGVLAKPNTDYDVSPWTGGGASFNLLLNTNFFINGIASFQVTVQSSILGAQNAMVAKVNSVAGKTVAYYDSGTKIFSIYPDNPAAGNAVSWSVVGGGSPAIPNPTALLTGEVTIDVFPQDELVPCTNFYIESATRLTDEIKLTSVVGRIIAKNGSSSFKLDEFILSLASVALTGYTQQFDQMAARSFNVPASSIRKFIEVKRRNDLDSGTRKYFSSNYALMWRWETWVSVLGVDPVFFDTSKPNNGFNEWWFQYAQISGWKLYYSLTVNATKNGIAQTYNSVTPVIPHDYKSNSAYTLKDILAFNPDDLSLLLSGSGGARQIQTGGATTVTINGQTYYTDGTNMLNTTKKTLLAAIYTKTTTPASVVVEMKMEVFQNGGVAGERVYSSAWVSDGNTWFSSIDGSNKVVLYAYGNSIIALAFLDPDADSSSFPSTEAFLSGAARIYEIGGVLETDDSIPITDDDGNFITID